jgi:hypothetical protein
LNICPWLPATGVRWRNYTPTLQYVWSIEGADGVTKVYRNHTFKTGFQIALKLFY